MTSERPRSKRRIKGGKKGGDAGSLIQGSFIEKKKKKSKQRYHTGYHTGYLLQCLTFPTQKPNGADGHTTIWDQAAKNLARGGEGFGPTPFQKEMS